MRLIDADALKKNGFVTPKTFKKGDMYLEVKAEDIATETTPVRRFFINDEIIDAIPTVEVEPINHGARPIDAGKLVELIDDDIASLDKNMSSEGYDVCLCTLQMVKQYIKALPTVEPKHGRWIMKWHIFYRVELPYCSACNKGATFKWDYCPNCGAKMDEVEE